MAHFAGLDVSIEETAVCVVDDQGAVLLQCSVVTEPEAIAKALAPFAVPTFGVIAVGGVALVVARRPASRLLLPANGECGVTTS